MCYFQRTQLQLASQASALSPPVSSFPGQKVHQRRRQDLLHQRHQRHERGGFLLPALRPGSL